MVDNNFKHATMTSKGQTLINGQKLVTMQKAIVGYVKKAMAHAPTFLDTYKQTLSENNINDLLDYVLDEMWEEDMTISDPKIGPSLGILLFICFLVPFSLNPKSV